VVFLHDGAGDQQRVMENLIKTDMFMFVSYLYLNIKTYKIKTVPA